MLVVGCGSDGDDDQMMMTSGRLTQRTCAANGGSGGNSRVARGSKVSPSAGRFSSFFFPLLLPIFFPSSSFFFFFAGGPPVWRSLVLAPFVSQSSGSYQVNRSLNRLVNTCVRFSDSSSLSLGGLHLFVGQLLVAKKKRETIERDRRNNRQRKAKVRKYLYDV